MTSVGGRLVGLLSEMRTGGTGEATTGISLANLRGKSFDFAVQEIARVLTPVNGDASKIARGLQLALSQAIDGMEVFDPSALTDGVLTDMLVVYVRETIFELIVMESGKAFQKTDDLAAILLAEQGLHDLVSVCVDKALRPLIADGIAGMSMSQLVEAQQQAIRDIWAEWESSQ